MSKPKAMRKMGTPGHYRPPRVGNMNMPGVARVGRVLPSPKILGPKRKPPSKR